MNNKTVVRAIGAGVVPYPAGWESGVSKLIGASWGHASGQPQQADTSGFWWMGNPASIRISAGFDTGAAVLLHWI